MAIYIQIIDSKFHQCEYTGHCIDFRQSQNIETHAVEIIWQKLQK